MAGHAEQSSGERIIEAAGQLEAVHRELEILKSDGGIAVTTRVRQSFAVDLEELWQCCVREDRLARWFAPVTGDLRLGGRFSVQDNATGTVERCAPPGGGQAGEMQLSWEFGRDVSQVVVRCEAAEPYRGESASHDSEAEGSSRLTVEHRGLIPWDFWSTYGPGAGGVGWDLALLGLAHHLRTGSTVPAEQTLWVTTAGAEEFIAGSSAAWGRASEAAGTPAEAAAAAAGRTTRFYTTPDSEE
ncbi:polyketide cyclase [Nesterenkonia xinjiangensis]|uniref:Uncharacterized protein YndB with AHSA1/START domain n=1 Tax=Nesterenkonia xinjiangensis TaxID=225327 RepID=A0A7Z0GKT9_9MICC|nr:polyketide cyclase [Nesterenkonia xinjiangensis]NYJ77274.1 uncharacterized protein YndB with AHSA1/START domain [Nesterenkonia xinjiangensis]